MRKEFNVEEFEKHKQIDENNLSAGMAENASLLGYYGYQQSLWRTVLDDLKIRQSVRQAEVMIEKSQEKEKAPGKHILDAYVDLDEEVIRIRKATAKASEQEKLFTIAVAALQERGRQLQSLGSNKRFEQEHSGKYGYHYSGGDSQLGDYKTYYTSSPPISSSKITGSSIPTGELSHARKEDILKLLRSVGKDKEV